MHLYLNKTIAFDCCLLFSSACNDSRYICTLLSLLYIILYNRSRIPDFGFVFSKNETRTLIKAAASMREFMVCWVIYLHIDSISITDLGMTLTVH